MKKLNLISLSIFFLAVPVLWAANENPVADLLRDKKILILGGTGYLGRAIAAGVLKYSPRKVYILSRDEIKHFNFLNDFGQDPRIKNIVGDIRDYECLLRNTRNVDIVFHVAALKRMDALESNVDESIKTNVMGSLNVFNACVQNNVKRVLFVSTDKACSPVNTYGASKFVAEKVFTNYDRDRINTIFTVVRFGNIIDSTGSVIPIFSEKIKRGENIPLTDSRMTRFIINRNEAVELIFNAITYATGGEIFLKKISAMKITDLIDVLKKIHNTNNKVNEIGIRPGEKIHEVLINEAEAPRTFEFDGMYVVVPNLQEWFDYFDNATHPLYLQRGIKGLGRLGQYSSDGAVISTDVLETYLSKFWSLLA